LAVKTGTRQSRYLQRNELTLAGRLLMRLLRLNGRTIDAISRSMKVSRQTVIAQTTSLGIVPAQDAAHRELQKSLLRELFARDSGLELESEFGRRLYDNILQHVIKTAMAPSGLATSRELDARELDHAPSPVGWSPCRRSDDADAVLSFRAG
jgi:hypothetical protein